MTFTNSSLITYKNITSNKTTNRNHAIDTITIHCFVGQVTAKQGCDYFKTTDREVSSNYVVGHDGSIGLSVDEKDRAWTSSNAANDHRAVTIEVACDSYAPYKVTNKAYNALVNLVADICQRNGIKELKWKGDKSLIGNVSKQNMTVHRWFASTACPGEWLYEKHSEIAQKVNAELKPKKETQTTTTTTAKTKLYRVRKTWEDKKSQLGAYNVLENAKNKADENPGYKVYDENGKVVYTPKTEKKKSVEEIAKEVIKGLWGNGAERRKKLEAAGYNYNDVQRYVNALLR